jgi:glycosyltransferase involved in cell wall biosynthesis
MQRKLTAVVRAADLVHVHSQWTFPVWWGCRTALAAGKPLVMSPQGCLDPVRLAHSAWKKRLAGLFDRRFLRQASVIHATSNAERGWIERYVGGRPRIEVIPNGVDLPAATSPAAKPAGRTRQVLSLGRLHPLKGLDLLIDAWQMASQELEPGDRWELVIAGPDEQGTRGGLEQKARQHGLSNVRFTGPLYGEDKAQALASADLFVLPSRSENFGIAVAEALAAGLPAITTKGAPWQEIHGSCGWWADVAAEPLATALREAMRLGDGERAAMGQRGRALVEAKYRWESVGRAMVGMYQAVTG